MNDVWAHRVLRERGVDTTQVKDQAAEITVFVDSIGLQHHGPEKNFRPYLHLSGELSSVRFAQPLPHDITTVTYERGYGERVDAFYEFDDQQLASLTSKGYFTEGFAVPSHITNIEWELPAIADALVLEPAEEDQLPIAWVKIHDIADVQIDLENSQYDLVEYFADHVHQVEGAALNRHVDKNAPSRADELDSLFEDTLEWESEAAPAALAKTVQPIEQTPDQALTSEIKELESLVEKEEQEAREELSRVPGSVENIYQEQIAAVLEKGQDAESEAEEAQPDSTAKPVAFEDSAIRKEVARRAAEIEAEGDEDYESLLKG